ncbi:DnaJ domain-containing protein [Toxoplasma gondii RUB]|uniref:DnaJ domain-containing protein n=2 Tax=Toxoplasma gondii TaxID=5811 RepID=A0A086LUJ6_TOXGO|nr:DnaJ domain-containing protein [Toxoplasma gondii RUB]KFH14093.1 DnaJ domain-containing protein [Toxoplasma gondii MAS]
MPPSPAAPLGSRDAEPEGGSCLNEIARGSPEKPQKGADSSFAAERRHSDTQESSRSEHPEEKTEEVRSHYAVLGVSTDASSEEIRRIYYGLCKLYHPDKSSSTAYSTRLCAIQQAYAVLSDETKRLLYDIRIGVYKGKDKWTKVAEVYQIQRERAARDIENMRIDYQSKLEHEKKVGGLIIRKALYGNLRLRHSLLEEEYSGPIREDCLEGPFLNVTIPLQCQVDNSRFIFPGGSGSSMELLNGFYNPAPCVHEQDVCLYVLYDFRGVLHEVTVCDRSYLAMPLKSHRVSPVTGPCGPFAPSNVRSLRPRGSSDKSLARSSPLDGEPQFQSLREATQREQALREEQRRRDRKLANFLFLSSIFAWSGLFLYASFYDKERVTAFLSRTLGERAAARWAVLLPRTLSPESQQVWLRTLRFDFLSRMWPFTVFQSGALVDRGGGR